jgi:hypothetical protein
MNRAEHFADGTLEMFVLSAGEWMAASLTLECKAGRSACGEEK